MCRYHRGANITPGMKLILHFLAQEFNVLLIQYVLLVQLMQSFIVGLHEADEVAKHHMTF